MIKNFINIYPTELTICNTIFTGMAVIGDLLTFNNKKFITNHSHANSNNLCSIFYIFGRDVEGGSTIYYDSKYDKQVAHVKIFQHGKYQVGHFDSVYHEGSEWKGARGIVSFYVNKMVYYHFLKHGRIYYDKWLEISNEGRMRTSIGLVGPLLERIKCCDIHKRKHAKIVKKKSKLYLFEF